MPLSGSASTVLRSPHVEVDVEFASVDDDAALCVRYRVRNIGSIAIAVFDRGNRHAVLTRQQVSGAVGVPRLRDDGAGAVMLLHVATGLPSPAPTLPSTPLGVRLAPGGELEAGFTFARWWSDPPRWVRWCLGVAVFDATAFHSPEKVADIEIWQASFALADRQQLLCTPWFEMAGGVFLASTWTPG